MVTLASTKQRRSGTAASRRTDTESWPDHRVHGFPAENDLRDLQFKLAHNLQSSLDLHTTLDLFFNNIQEAVSVNGLHYRCPEDVSNLELGNICPHKASYKVSSADLKLGQIVFSRAKPFLEAELAALEMMVGVLFYPLRNALLYQQALENSLRDSLTGIGNRAAFDANFDRELKLAQRHKQHLSLLVIDIDHFKNVNDCYGHQNGDRILKHAATSIQAGLRETDQVFRYGGEEFVVVLSNTCHKDAHLIAERIRLKVAMSPTRVDNSDVLVTASIGISKLKECDHTETLFNRADQALYRAKALGRNRVEAG
ncbi:GGDEF domain-containing protein [Teredinibacter haidensis]|uniref:GGDEF domain-containing protein n=1 Tax=Teredinibacter haidensis TaxID=2731755 RepID=UPI000948E4D1|nr:GGDEF domain-containing protein [Teredinibacter haidensis]